MSVCDSKRQHIPGSGARMLTYAHVCARMRTYAATANVSISLALAHVCSRMRTHAHVCCDSIRQHIPGAGVARPAQALLCVRMRTYAHVCARMRTYAAQQDQLHAAQALLCVRMRTYAHVCARMLP